MAAFWRPLREEVDNSRLSRAELGRLLRLSASALSELLNGRRAKAPSWDVVEAIVIASEKARGHPANSAGTKRQLAYWRQRLEELETELVLTTAREGAARPQSRPVRAGCPGCDAYEEQHFRSYANGWAVRSDQPQGLIAATLLLAGRHTELRTEVEYLFLDVLRRPEDLAAFRDQFDVIVRRLLAGLGARVRSACHPHRVRLLHAAHIVVLTEGCVRSPVLDSRWNSEQPAAEGLQLLSVFGESIGDGTLAAAPLPVANVTYTDHHERVVSHYAEIASALAPSLPWEENAVTAREAAALYEARLAELAAECPELFVWTGMQDGAEAVRPLSACPKGEARDRLEELYRDLHEQKLGLDGLETLLRALSRRTAPGEWPARLSDIYRNELGRPISPIGETGDGQPGPRIPRLDKGYVNPAFRTAVYDADGTPHIDAWWNTRPLREEIQGFLAGHLTGFPTVNRPLLVLGDPGAGKSLLTRLLAARLPPEDYLPIRIELRSVRADADIREQIAQALRLATHKDLTWATVTEPRGGALPVLIFDGFDELLQAGGADHWYYLEEIADFQRISADNGLPVAAIVTSRTVVADQAKIPDGSVVIRLEPFDDTRIARWTKAWNIANKSYFDRRGTAPLPDHMGTLYPDLAPQPLLLLMLALYYAVVQRPGIDDTASLSRVDLYERLLRLFVRRQITKLEPRLRPEAMEERIDKELDLLSVIAAAMFNRGRQGVSAEEADHDLRFLRAPDISAACPEARLLFGRFFFIHEAKATFDGGSDRRWYEFLHATFGEHLVARKIAHTLVHCPDQGRYDGLLFDLLAFSPLTDRAQIVDNLRDLLPSGEAVRSLFRTALDERPAESRTGYTARSVPLTYRHACYSANLLLLALAPGDVVHFSELAPDGMSTADSWASHAMLWKSQLSPKPWDAFTRAVGAVPVPGPRDDEDQRDIALRLGQHDALPTVSNVAWMLNVAELDPMGAWLVAGKGPEEALRRSRLPYDRDTEGLLEPVLSVCEDFPELFSVYVIDSQGHGESAAHALIMLLMCAPAPAEGLLQRYEACLRSLGAHLGAAAPRVIGLISQRLAGESERLPPDFVTDTVRRLIHYWFRADAVGDSTRIALLSCLCRTLAHADGEPLVPEIGRLLDTDVVMDAPDLRLKAAASTGRVLATLFHRIAKTPPTQQRSRALVWLLKLAVALDQREWCHQYAVRLLGELHGEAWTRLLASEAEYVRQSLSDGPLELVHRLSAVEDAAGRYH
jgi:transcriptional regulator with XRE-family HTH domain